MKHRSKFSRELGVGYVSGKSSPKRKTSKHGRCSKDCPEKVWGKRLRLQSLMTMYKSDIRQGNYKNLLESSKKYKAHQRNPEGKSSTSRGRML